MVVMLVLLALHSTPMMSAYQSIASSWCINSTHSRTGILDRVRSYSLVGANSIRLETEDKFLCANSTYCYSMQEEVTKRSACAHVEEACVYVRINQCACNREAHTRFPTADGLQLFFNKSFKIPLRSHLGHSSYGCHSAFHAVDSKTYAGLLGFRKRG